MGPRGMTQSKQICMIIKLEQGKFLQIDNAPGLAKKLWNECWRAICLR